MSPNLCLSLTLAVLVGCSASTSDTGETDTGTPACIEAADLAADECATTTCLEADPLTCSYGDVSIDSDDCSCHARLELYEALCESDTQDSVETIDAGTSCEP